MFLMTRRRTESWIYWIVVDVIGIGLVNYDSNEIGRIRGCRTAEIESRLGYRHSDEVIHRDHFALVDELESHPQDGGAA